MRESTETTTTRNIQKTKGRIRINTVLDGELAAFVLELRKRGRISTFTEVVNRGIELLQRFELETQTIKHRLDNPESD